MSKFKLYLHITTIVHSRNAKDNRTSEMILADSIENLQMLWRIYPAQDSFPFSAFLAIILMAKLYDAIPHPNDI